MGPFAGARIGKSLYRLSASKQKANQPSLKTFICGRNRLENGSSGFLSLGLKAHKDLRVVKLYQNGIRPQGIANLILNGLKHNKELSVLDLQDNTITTKSAKILAENLSNWKNLKELNVNDCLLKPKGALSLVNSFNASVWNNLEVLKLQYNELDETALEVLADAVKSKFPNLKVLELNGNRFEEENSTIEEISAVFEERGFGELDELDDLEEVDSDEEEEEEEEEEEGAAEEIDFHALEKELQIEQETFTPERENKEIDELTSKLEKAAI
jgi:Ran GTPase-activating protein 1